MRRPYFLLRDMNPQLRKRLEADAREHERPMAEIIRVILCDHYTLDCKQITGVRRDDQWKKTTTILLKMQPELFLAIKKDAKETGETMRSLILDALETHYQGAVT